MLVGGFREGDHGFVLTARAERDRRYLLTTFPSTANLAAALSAGLRLLGSGAGGLVRESSVVALERVMKGRMREARASRSVDILLGWTL